MGDLIIGSAATTQTTTPALGQVAPPATPTPQTSVVPSGQTVSPINPATTQSFLTGLANQIQQNPLNLYWQPTYHLKLFMAGDDFVFDKAGSIQGLISQINGNSIRQVIIAETGVTGYNIKSVEFETVYSQNEVTREQAATFLTMVITEPMGVSFLDALIAGAAYLNIFDYTKMNYFLMVSFTGYNSDAGPGAEGSYAGNPIKFPAPFANGGQWLYVIKINTIEVKVNEGASVYTIQATFTDSEPVIIEEKVLSTMTDGLTVSGATVGAMFTDFTTQLNAKWQEKFLNIGNTNQALMDFTIMTHPIPWANNRDPKDFSTLNAKPLDSSARSLTMNTNTNGIPTAHVPPGMTVNDFISSVIHATEEGQQVMVDDPNPANPDTSAAPGSQPTPTGSRKNTLFSTEPLITVDAKDPKTGNYGKHIVIHVTPTLSQTAILDPADRDAANNPAVQRQKVADLPWLNKEYDYIFTGLNTEVIDFNIDFKLAWQAMIPKMGGIRAFAPNEAVGPQYHFYLPVAPQPNITNADMASCQIQSIVQSPNASGGKLYIEDILSASNQGQSVALPISFWPHWQDIESQYPAGMTANWTPAATIAATVIAQVFANTELSNAFMRIELSIRGDPYWLGSANVERQIQLSGSGPSYIPTGTPDGSSALPKFILKFRYPLQVGDDFKPVLKDSAIFNGVYEVWKVKHHFEDGAFKQTLFANRMPLVNLNVAASSAPFTNTDQNSSGVAGPGQSGGLGTPGTGTTPGTGSSTIAPTGGPPNSAQVQALAQQSYNFWIANGYSPAGAAAMVSQEEAESQFGTDPNTNNASGAGNFQWNAQRQAQILNGTGINVATDTNHQDQLQAALWEQNNTFASVGSQLMTATDPGAAGVLATTKYEIPANTAAAAQVRGGRSAYWAGALGPTSTLTAS